MSVRFSFRIHLVDVCELHKKRRIFEKGRPSLFDPGCCCCVVLCRRALVKKAAGPSHTVNLTKTHRPPSAV